MAVERDITGRSVVRAAQIVTNVKRRVRDRISLGPRQVRMTPAAFRRAIESAPPDVAAQYLQQLGPEKFLELMLGKTRASRTSSIDKFLEES